jgi:hypothetical protein
MGLLTLMDGYGEASLVLWMYTEHCSGTINILIIVSIAENNQRFYSLHYLLHLRYCTWTRVQNIYTSISLSASKIPATRHSNNTQR